MIASRPVVWRDSLIAPSTASAARSARPALVSLGCDQDLQRRAILADHPYAVPRDTRAERSREAVGPLVAHPHLQDPVPVVLRAKLPYASHLAERELEPMPVIGRRKRCHDKVDLAGSRRGARRWDGGLGLSIFLDERLLDHRALRAVLLRRHETRLRRRRDRSIEAGRRRRRGLVRWRGFGRRRFRRRLTRADTRRQIDDLVVSGPFLFLLVVLSHFYPRRRSRYHTMTTTITASTSTAMTMVADQRRAPEASARSIAARISSAVASFRSHPCPCAKRSARRRPSWGLPESTMVGIGSTSVRPVGTSPPSTSARSASQPSRPDATCSSDCARLTSYRSSIRSSASSAAPMLGCPTTSRTFGRVMRG